MSPVRLQKSEFIPERLTELRELNGWSMIKLAAELGVSTTIVSNYERGRSKPGSSVLARLAELFNVPVHYFMRAGIRPDSLRSVITFRRLGSATLRMRTMASRAQDRIATLLAYLTEFVDFPSVDLPPPIEKDFRDLSDDDIEEVAFRYREHWSLGKGPIDSMVATVEAHGIVVSCIELANADKIDAFSCWRGARPLVILGKAKNSAARSRFDAAHELGHIALHSTVLKEDTENSRTLALIEKQANRFAGAFLLPAESFAQEFISQNLSFLVSLKRRWRVSLAAMVYRGADLGFISENQKSYIYRQLSSNGFRRREPLDDELEVEYPSLLASAIKMLIESRVQSRSEMLEVLMLGHEVIEEYASLPRGYFKAETGKVIHLNFRSSFPEGDK